MKGTPMKNIETIEELFSLTHEKLVGQSGAISINFANRTHVYSGNDVIGNCLQEWLPSWFSFLGVDIQAGEHTQEFPDFVANFDGISYDVEVKAWNVNNAPAFDLANFFSFLDTTYNEPGKLNAHYFILGYRPATDGFSQGFQLEKVYLKHIWEITNPSRNYSIGLQVKRGIPYAMRPCNFYRNEDKHFSDIFEFVSAVTDAFKEFELAADLPFTPEEWYDRVMSYL